MGPLAIVCARLLVAQIHRQSHKLAAGTGTRGPVKGEMYIVASVSPGNKSIIFFLSVCLSVLSSFLLFLLFLFLVIYFLRCYEVSGSSLSQPGFST